MLNTFSSIYGKCVKVIPNRGFNLIACLLGSVSPKLLNKTDESQENT